MRVKETGNGKYAIKREEDVVQEWRMTERERE